MAQLLEANGAEMVAKVGYVYHFAVRKSEGEEPTYFTLDLKNDNGAAVEGKVGEADATFIMLD